MSLRGLAALEPSEIGAVCPAALSPSLPSEAAFDELSYTWVGSPNVSDAL